MKKNDSKFEITEIFMAKAGWYRCFHGTIRRSTDKYNNPIVFGKIYVKNDVHSRYITSNIG